MQSNLEYDQNMDRIQCMQQELAEMTELLGLPAPPVPATCHHQQTQQHELQQHRSSLRKAVDCLAGQPDWQQNLPAQQRKVNVPAAPVVPIASAALCLESVPSDGSSTTTVAATALGAPTAVQVKIEPDVAAVAARVDLRLGGASLMFSQQQAGAHFKPSSVPNAKAASVGHMVNPIRPQRHLQAAHLTSQQQYRLCAECGVDSNMCQQPWQRDRKDCQRVLCHACVGRAAAAAKQGTAPAPPPSAPWPPIPVYMLDSTTRLMCHNKQMQIKGVVPAQPSPSHLPVVTGSSSSFAISMPSSSRQIAFTAAAAAAAAGASTPSTLEAAAALASAAITAAPAAPAALAELQYQNLQKRPCRRPADTAAHQCANCGATDSSRWSFDSVDRQRSICNACRQYKRTHGVDRPLLLALHALHRRKKRQVAMTAVQGLLQSMAAGTQVPAVIPTAYMTAAQLAAATSAAPVACHPLQPAAPMSYARAVPQRAGQPSAAIVQMTDNSDNIVPVQYRPPASADRPITTTTAGASAAAAAAAVTETAGHSAAVLRPALAAGASKQRQEAGYSAKEYGKQQGLVWEGNPAVGEPMTVDVKHDDKSDVLAEAMQANTEEVLEDGDVESAAVAAAAGVKPFLQRWVDLQQHT